jgi:hypothetical protein
MSLPSPKTIAILSVLLLGVIAASFALNGPLFAESPAKDKDKAPAKPKAPPAAQPQAGAEKPQFAPVIEAQKNGVMTCLPMVGDLSRFSIGAPHTSVASWSREAANERMFTALSFPAQANPGAGFVSLISATPTPKGHCDGSNVRVESSKQSCDEIAGDLQKKNVPKPETINGTLLFPPNAAGQRLVLLPAATSGCVVISTGGYFGR